MKVLRSSGQPDLIYVMLSDADAEALRDALRKRKEPMVKQLRDELKKVLRGR